MVSWELLAMTQTFSPAGGLTCRGVGNAVDCESEVAIEYMPTDAMGFTQAVAVPATKSARRTSAEYPMFPGSRPTDRLVMLTGVVVGPTTGSSPFNRFANDHGLTGGTKRAPTVPLTGP